MFNNFLKQLVPVDLTKRHSNERKWCICRGGVFVTLTGILQPLFVMFIRSQQFWCLLPWKAVAAHSRRLVFLVFVDRCLKHTLKQHHTSDAKSKAEEQLEKLRWAGKILNYCCVISVTMTEKALTWKFQDDLGGKKAKLPTKQWR